MKFNLLFVSIAFPPKNDPECLQTARYFKYLARQTNWNIDVVTSKQPTLFMPFDESLLNYDKGYRQKIEIPIVESKFGNYVQRKLGFGFLQFPDSKMTFHWQWRKVIRRLVNKPDAIYSRSNPISSAFMAMKLSLYYRCPWILHLSDPWAISPLREIPPRLLANYLQAENMMLNKAEAITFTTVPTLELYAQKYPQYSYKFSVLPNVYDPDDVHEISLPFNDKFRVVYAGGLTGKRNVFFLKEVLEIVSRERPAVLKKIEFVFAGDMDRTNRQFFESPIECIKHIGQMPYDAVKKLCLSAQVLLVVDNPTEKEGAIFFPSKILDYFLTRRKIWAVTPLHSVTRDILEQYNHNAFEHNQVEGMANFLIESVAAFEERGNAAFQAGQIPIQFGAATNAVALSKLILNKTAR